MISRPQHDNYNDLFKTVEKTHNENLKSLTFALKNMKKNPLRYEIELLEVELKRAMKKVCDSSAGAVMTLIAFRGIISMCKTSDL